MPLQTDLTKWHVFFTGENIENLHESPYDDFYVESDFPTNDSNEHIIREATISHIGT